MVWQRSQAYNGNLPTNNTVSSSEQKAWFHLTGCTVYLKHLWSWFCLLWNAPLPLVHTTMILLKQEKNFISLQKMSSMIRLLCTYVIFCKRKKYHHSKNYLYWLYCYPWAMNTSVTLADDAANRLYWRYRCGATLGCQGSLFLTWINFTPSMDM